MTFRNSSNTNSSGVRRSGQRLIDYKVAIALELIALVTWLTGRNGGGSACLAGTCLKAALTQPSNPTDGDRH